MVIDAATKVRELGDPPATGTSYYNVRAIDKILADGVNWFEELRGELYPNWKE
jgi:hypothetical protein